MDTADLVLEKLAAGRTHDFEFATEAIRAGLVDPEQLELGVDLMPESRNFFVNTGETKSADIKSLIDLTQKTVFEKFGVMLELEVELLGEW